MINNKSKKDIHNYLNMRQSVFILIWKIIVIEVIIIVAHLLFKNIIMSLGLHDTNIIGLNIESFELILFHSITIISMLVIIIKRLSYYYIITDKEIFNFQGVISKKEYSYDINGTQGISIKQTLLGRIFGYGTINIENPLMKDPIIIKNIQNPAYCVAVIKLERDKIKEDYNQDKIIPLQ